MTCGLEETQISEIECFFFFFDKRNKQLKTMLDRQGSVEQVGAELAHIGAGTIYTQLSRTSLEM